MINHHRSRRHARPKIRRRGWESLEKRLLLANWSGDIANGTVWDNSQVQQIVGNVHVPAGDTLTIKPGTVVKFDVGTKLTVDGTLNAQGAAGQTIYFTSIFDDTVGGDTDGDGGATAPAAGQWGQVLFTGTSTADVLDQVVVRYGARGLDAEVEADGASPTISNCVVSNSPFFGLRLKGSDATLTADTFQNNDVPDNGFAAGGAIHMDVNSQPVIQGATFTNNHVNGVWVDAGTLPAGTTRWNNPDAVDYVPNTVTVPQGATLAIGAGQVVKLGQSLIVQGTLTAQGTASQPAVFTSFNDDSAGGDTNNDGGANKPAAGQWGRLLFTSTSTADVLEQVVVRYGGGNVDAEVEADGASPTISNSVVSDAPVYGLRLTASAANLTGDTFQNNDVPDNGFGAGGAIHIDVNSQPVIQGITFANNHVNAVLIDPGTLPAGTTTWNNIDVVYYVPSTVTVPQGATLTIAAGQVVKLGQSLIVQGTLTAQGTASQPVIFTSFEDDSAGGDSNNDGSASTPHPGQWSQLLFTSTSTADVLDHVVARYGGGNVNAEVEADGASPILSNSVVSDSPVFGLRLTASAANLTGDTFQNNDVPDNGFGSGGAIHMDVNSQPDLQGVTLTNNHVNAVWVDAGALPAGTTTWNYPNVVYFLPNTVTVPQGATLAIAAGQVVKLQQSIVVQGTLTAQGTAAQPVIFTSFEDDTAGGDSNGDGPSIGNNVDWNGLEFTSTSTGGVLNHVEARYGSNASDGTFGMISVTGASLIVSNSVIRNSGHVGIYANTGSNLTLTDSLVVNSSYNGLQGEAGAALTVVNCTIDGNLRGVVLDSPTATLTNDLITNNRSDGISQNGPTTLAMSFSDVFNPGASNYTGLSDQTNTNGNLSADPRYFNQPGGQYELHPGSPAEDAGTSAGAPATDILGNPRFKDPNLPGRGDGSGYDMGAFEVEQTATSNVDLAATSVSGPSTGLEDQSVTVNWTVASVGAGVAAGSWHDAVYLSASPVFTPDAILLGEVQHTGDLGPGQSYNGTGTFTLPGVVPGNDYFIVRANSRNEVFEGAALLNNAIASTATVAMDLPALTLGTPLAGQLAATGNGELYKVTTVAGGNLNVTLAGAAGNTNELYVAFGDVPTRQSFDARGVHVGSGNQSVSLANTKAGTYYILVYGASVPSVESFSLTASSAGFSLSSVSPGQGSNTGQVTISIDGAQFDGNSQPQLVDSADVTIKPLAVYYTDSGLVSATFDLTGLPTGAADVQVLNTGGLTQTLPHAFDIIAGQPGRLVTNLLVPSGVRAGHSFSIFVDYRNAGDTDLLAPVLQITNTGPAQLSITPDFAFESNSFNLVASSATGAAGVIPPGGEGQITLYATASGAGQSSFQLSVADYGTGPINWSAIGPSLRPESVTDAQWAALFPQVQTDIGNSWGQYQKIIAADTTLLPPALGSNDSLNDVFKLEFEKALAQLSPSVSGQLFLDDTNHPLANVPITLIDPTTGNSYQTVSLNDGTFLLPGAGQGSYEVDLQGFIPTSSNPLVVGPNGLSGAQILTAPGSSISGSVVLGPDGSPLPGELVTAVNQLGQSFGATTGADGTYVIDSLPAGIYQVNAGGNTYAQGSVGGVTLAAGQVAPHIDVNLAPGGTIQGTVSGPVGPLAGAQVTAIGTDGTSMAWQTSASGAYDIGGLSGQAYTIDVQASGFVRQQLDGVNLLSGATDSGVNVVLGAAGGISGTLTSAADGAPVNGVTVEFSSAGITVDVVSDANGQISLANVAPGTYTVTALAGGGLMTTTANVAVTAGATAQFTLALAPLGKVTGIVTNSVNGQPVQMVTVYAADAGGFVRSTTTDANGHYELDNFDAGAYQILLGDEMTPGLAESQVTFDAIHDSATANFSVALAGLVSGTVFQADGTTPIANALVALVLNGQVVLSMNTDPNGSYVFDLVAAGTYQLEADSPGVEFPVLSGLAVAGGNSLIGLNFVAGTDTITGVVSDAASGQPLVGANVALSRADAGVTLRVVGTSTTAANGTFNFTGLVPGTYTLADSATGHATTLQTVNVVHTTATSANLALGVESTVRGTIRDARTGAAVAGAVVVVSSTAGISSTSQTDTSGDFVASGLAQGTYHVSITAAGYETLVAGPIVVGPGSQLVDQSLNPRGITVAGTVQGSGGPLSQVEVVATDANGFVVGQATTATDGSFSIATLPSGTVSITAFGSGYQSTAPTVIVVKEGDHLTNLSPPVTAIGLSDITLTGPFKDILTAIIAASPGLLNLVRRGIPTAYQLSPTEFALLHSSVVGSCSKLQVAALNAQGDVQRQLKTLNDGSNGFGDNLDAYTASARKLLAEETAVGRVLKLFEVASPVLMVLDPKFGDYFNKLSGDFPKSADLDFVTASTEVAIEDVFAFESSTGAATTTDLDGAATLLDALLDPKGSLGGPLASFFGNAAFIDAILTVASGGDDSSFVPYLTLPQQVILGVAAATIKGDPKIAAAVADIKPFADALFAQVKDIKDQITKESSLIKAMSGYINQITNYWDLIRNFNGALSALQCCVDAHTPAPGSGTGASQSALLAGSITVAADASSVGGVCVLCGCTCVKPPGDDPVNSGSTTVGGASDPNNLTGPAGFGPQGFIQAGTFGYEVDFENDPTKATAAAQVVTATLTLDPNLDPGTFQFTSFGFGSHTFAVPSGLSHYQTTIDLRPDGVDLLVPVTLNENPATGVVNITFQSLDPATMQPPDGINSGFLAVDDANRDGEGFFTYTVAPKTGLATGTAISEQASIVFDTNAAIATPTATNTLDVGDPTSSVAALPAQSAASFTVHWSGSDDAGGSGIAFFDVFVSDNGGPFTAFQTATTATSATFTGVSGHTYGFYSVATDNVGNRQATPTAAQATTTVSSATVLATSSVAALPANESSTHFTVSWSGTDAGGPGIANYDVFVSDNGGPFTAFQTATTATSATFTGVNAHTYGFYSVAIDSAGNRQATPTAAQATTTVSVATVLPTSSVAPLPATESSTSFTVSWSGTDAGGPGIASHDVFVSDNGGAFTAFQTGTAQTSATFNGVNGHAYGFYSVAIDSVGNRQATPTAAQATTTVSVVTVLPTSSVAALPATEATTHFAVSWSGTDSGGPGIANYDVFVSDNGGNSTAFQTATAATSATFTGVNGHTYGFYSVATDSVGNRQTTPTAAQASTTVSVVTVLPTSSVAPLAATSPASFTVSWSGSDSGGPGIASFGVFVSDNGGPFAAFQTATMATSATFTGVNGHSYGFYSVATDTAGNRQATPAAAQATTQVATDPNQRYVGAVYQDVLGRAPDAGGLAFWTQSLDAGTAVGSVAEAIAHSDEYYQNFVIRPAYSNLLGRAADASGVTYWTGQMDGGVTDQQLEADLVSSPEFFSNAGGTNTLWIDAVYKLLLGRAPDMDGEMFWNNQLAAGQTLNQVAQGIAGSQENNTQLINDDYFHYLGRTADSGGLAFWLSEFAAGKTNEDVIAGFTGSSEYYNKHTS